MIQTATIEFLRDLKQHNVKTWFDENRKRYESARTNFLEANERLIQGVESFDEGIAIASLEPKKTIMRINRDIRFSKDKSPYNPRFFTYLGQGGKSAPFAGYYLQIAPDESFYGGGLFMPDNKILLRVRSGIEANLSAWEKIVQDDHWKHVYGELLSNGKLTRPPKGFDKDSPALEWIKWKGFYVSKELTDEEATREDVIEQIVENLQVLRPLVAFLNESINQYA